MTDALKDFYKAIDGDFYDDQIRSLNPLRKWFHGNRYKIISDLVTAKFDNGMKIIDLACGSCNWNTKGLDVFGMDWNENLLKNAKERGRLSNYKMGDICDTGLVDNSFDIAVASEVLEHIVNYDRLVREIKRILKPGGYAVISVPFDTVFSLWRHLFFLQCLFQGYILGKDYYRKSCGHINHFSPQTLAALFIRHDFMIDAEFDMRRFTIFLVAQKSGVQAPSAPFEDLTIILPTLNEGPNIGEMLDRLTSNYRGARIIISDDGSKDNTKDIALSFKNKNVLFLDRGIQPQHGLTISILDAINLVKTRYFIVIDADGQHPWQKIKEMINYLRLSGGVVLGSRVKVSEKWPLHRKALSYAGTMLGKISLILRGKPYLSYDILTGFFGAETSLWKANAAGKENINTFRAKGYKIVFDFLKVADCGIKIGEVYYEFNRREKAVSKINSKVHMEYLKSIFS